MAAYGRSISLFDFLVSTHSVCRKAEIEDILAQSETYSRRLNALIADVNALSEARLAKLPEALTALLRVHHEPVALVVGICAQSDQALEPRPHLRDPAVRGMVEAFRDLRMKVLRRWRMKVAAWWSGNLNVDDCWASPVKQLQARALAH